MSRGGYRPGAGRKKAGSGEASAAGTNPLAVTHESVNPALGRRLDAATLAAVAPAPHARRAAEADVMAKLRVAIALMQEAQRDLASLHGGAS
jgi:hypothetical protein